MARITRIDKARQADRIRVIRANSLFKGLPVAAQRGEAAMGLSLASVGSTADIEHAYHCVGMAPGVVSYCMSENYVSRKDARIAEVNPVAVLSS